MTINLQAKLFPLFLARRRKRILFCMGGQSLVLLSIITHK